MIFSPSGHTIFSSLGTVSASLTTSYTGRPCPGEEVTLTCTVIGDLLTWESSVFVDVQYVRAFVTINVTTSPATGFYTTVTSLTPTTITSTLMLDTALITIPEGGVTVTCVFVGTETIQLAGENCPMKC